MENWPWPRVSPTGSSRPTKLLSTSGTHSSNAFWRKIRFHLTNCSVWLPPLSRLSLGFHYGIDKGFLIKLARIAALSVFTFWLFDCLYSFRNGQSAQCVRLRPHFLLICIVRKLHAGKSADEQVKNHSGFFWFLTCNKGCWFRHLLALDTDKGSVSQTDTLRGLSIDECT